MRKKFTFSLQRKALALMATAMVAFGSSAYAQTLTALDGSTAGSAAGEGYAQLVDGKVATKWGQSFDPANKPWVIFKAEEAFVPSNYFLITGNDTGSNPGRNWSQWKIYGANFESDEAATRDAEGWVLIDQKVRASLPGKNFGTATFTCSEAPAEAYKYFRIEIEALDNVQVTYMQMSEFGFGDPDQLKSIAYSFIWSTDEGGEGGDKLIDGKAGTKWGYGSDNHKGVVIFRSTKSIMPTYYTLLTGGDSGSYPGRNWADYTLYGGNFASDEEAKADYDNHIANRDFKGFKAIEVREGVGSDLIPDKNLYEVFISMKEPATESYEYFMIIVDRCVGGAFCQMSEFTWGSAEQFTWTKTDMYNQYKALDHSVLASQALYDEYDKAVEAIMDIEDPSQLSVVKENLEQIKTKINVSNGLYMDYVTVVNRVKSELEKGGISDATVAAQMQAYVDEEIAPNETHPVGSYKYIVSKRQLNDEEIAEETNRLSAILDQYGPQADPIHVSYNALDGTAGFGATENFASLVDGDDNTKWCHMHNDGLSWGIFKTSEPIAPSMMRLFTSGDTGSNPGRNWKRWKIFGGNFESDEAATKDAEGWVVIDDQTNANLPAESNKAVFRNLSTPSDTPYSYFKVEIYESMGSDRMQMSELTFMNQGNFRELREQYVEQFREMFDQTGSEEFVAEQKLIETFRENFEKLQVVLNVVDLGNLYNALNKGFNDLKLSNKAYVALQETMNEMISYSFTHEDDIAFFDDYLSSEKTPEELAPYGSLNYIINNGSLDSVAVNSLVNHMNNTIASLNDPTIPVPLGGSGTWGDGAYSQLYDKDPATKWGGGIGDSAWHIIKWMDPIVPFFYQVQTAWDASKYGSRNWKSWNIYGGNFSNDLLATADAKEGWVLIEKKENVLERRLPSENGVWAPFGFSNESNIPEEGFRYYMVVVTKTGTDAQQMSEMEFGEEEDFYGGAGKEGLRDTYVNELKENNTDVVAETRLIQAYEDAVTEVEESEGVEEMFLKYYAALTAWDSVTTSVNNYNRYITATEDVELFLEKNPLTESDALANLKSYLEQNVEPSEEGYPNGSKQYIVENHVLADSVVIAEIDYLESLKAAAVRSGYLAGCEVTSLLNNPTFANGAEGWDGTGVYSFGTYGNVENGYMSVAECVEMDTLDLSQTLTGMKNGLYVLEMNAGYRPAGNFDSYNHVAYIYANDNIVPVHTVREGMILKADAVDGVNCHISGSITDHAIIDTESAIENDTMGYVINGVEGSAYAFRSGRYYNAIVANVTDGTLKVGIRNPFSAAPNTQEWVGFGNTKLTYLGEAEGADVELLDSVLNSCKGRATAMTVLYECQPDENYAIAPNFSDAEKTALTNLSEQIDAAATAQAKYDLAVKFSDTFKSVANTKSAYVDYFEKNLAVFEHWADQVVFLNEETGAAFQKDVVGGQDNWIFGMFSAEEAEEAAAKLVVKFPDYLSEVANTDILGRPENMTQTEPFTYDFTLDAAASTMVALDGLYDGLTEDEIILSFEYKADGDDMKTYVYFNNPGVSRGRSLLLEGMEPASEWKTMYYNVSHARKGNFVSVVSPWGQNKDHGIGFEFEGGKTVSIRNVRMVTLKDVEDAGGTVGIGQIVDNETKLEQKGIYTISGTRVNKATKGLYIIDGKKVIVND